MEKRSTIRDVAKAAGVSIATVSNAYNGIDKVSEETRQMIFEVARELDYQPNMVARGLSRKKSGLIGLLLPIIEEDGEPGLPLEKNPYYAEFLSGMEKKATEMKYDIVIRGLRPEESCREWIMRRQLEGAVFIGNTPEAIANDSRELGTRLVLLDAYVECNYATIRVEDEKGGQMAVSYLMKKGHRNIAFAGSQIQFDGCIRRRYLGYEKEMSGHGLFREQLVYKSALNYEGGLETGRQMLKSKIPITAVFAASDTIAFGIMAAYREAGRTIPEDLSVIGFDNISSCDLTYPRLTSVDQSAFQKGIRAVEVLCSEAEGVQKPPANVVLPVSIKERDSVRSI
ncbi:MAG: LacI family transcriptional regulator [Lachnospiraceae bacterium]|nr:LacI family transcriptional regulator [Lachnospiraceae bacterium]